MASNPGIVAPRAGSVIQQDVVEIALLLPGDRAEALIELSRRRQKSVGQILRGLIDRELAEAED